MKIANFNGKSLIKNIDAWEGKNGKPAFWWLGQAGVVLMLKDRIVYIDPYLSPGKKRLQPPLLVPEQITHADLVLGTHDHDDHIDPYAISGIASASPKAVFVVPQTACLRLENLGIKPQRIHGMNAGEQYKCGNIVITAVKAKHEAFDETPEGLFPYLGYIIQCGRECIYHAGDTLVYEGLISFLQSFHIRVAFLPINGRDAKRYSSGCLGNMTYQEAVDLAGELKPKLAVPIHYGMFAHNTEDPKLFAEYLKMKYPDIKCVLAAVGKCIEI